MTPHRPTEPRPRRGPFPPSAAWLLAALLLLVPATTFASRAPDPRTRVRASAISWPPARGARFPGNDACIGVARCRYGRIASDRTDETIHPDLSRIALAHDELGRLKTATYPGGLTEALLYDPNGNLLSVTRGRTTERFSYNLADEVLARQILDDGIAGNLFTVTSDERGNVTKIRLSANGGQIPIDERVFRWDAQGRLVEVTKNQLLALRASYLDDYRLDKEDTPTNGPLTNLWSFGNVLLERDGLSGSEQTDYITIFGLDNHLARGPPGPGKDLVLTDHIGTVLAETDPQGTPKQSHEYFAFGGHRAGDVPVKVGFHGARLYEDAGLYYFRKRWYSPELGRFISRDPIGFAGGYNLYQYGLANPVSMRDSRGDFPPLIAFLLFAAARGGASVAIDSALRILQGGDFPSSWDVAESFTLGAIIPGGKAAATTAKGALGLLIHGSKEFILETVGGVLFDQIKAAFCAGDTDLARNLLRRALQNAIGRGMAAPMKWLAGAMGRLRNRFRGTGGGGSALDGLGMIGVGGGDAPSGGPRRLYHYTDAPESSFNRGMWSHTSVTDNPNLSPQEAIGLLGVRRPPIRIIPVQDRGHFIENRPHIVEPHPLGPGGGTDFINPNPVPPEDLLPAIPVRIR